MTGKASATGELVDGVCDYFGNIVMYFAFAFWLDDTLGGWAWVLAAGAGASHVLQTNHSETQRRLYALARLRPSPGFATPREAGDDVFRKETWFTRYFGFWAVGYVWLSNRMSPSANPVDDGADAPRATRARRRGSAPWSAPIRAASLVAGEIARRQSQDLDHRGQHRCWAARFIISSR